MANAACYPKCLASLGGIKITNGIADPSLSTTCMRCSMDVISGATPSPYLQRYRLVPFVHRPFLARSTSMMQQSMPYCKLPESPGKLACRLMQTCSCHCATAAII